MLLPIGELQRIPRMSEVNHGREKAARVGRQVLKRPCQARACTERHHGPRQAPSCSGCGEEKIPPIAERAEGTGVPQHLLGADGGMEHQHERCPRDVGGGDRPPLSRRQMWPGYPLGGQPCPRPTGTEFLQACSPRDVRPGAIQLLPSTSGVGEAERGGFARRGMGRGTRAPRAGHGDRLLPTCGNPQQASMLEAAAFGSRPHCRVGVLSRGAGQRRDASRTARRGAGQQTRPRACSHEPAAQHEGSPAPRVPNTAPEDHWPDSGVGWGLASKGFRRLPVFCLP